MSLCRQSVVQDARGIPAVYPEILLLVLGFIASIHKAQFHLQVSKNKVVISFSSNFIDLLNCILGLLGNGNVLWTPN